MQKPPVSFDSIDTPAARRLAAIKKNMLIDKLYQSPSQTRVRLVRVQSDAGETRPQKTNVVKTTVVKPAKANWTDKVAVVTGGSSGLGRAIASHFASQGARVVCLARDENKLAATVEELNQSGDAVSAVVADVTQDASVAAAVAEVQRSHGQIDLWVNNVGRSLRIALPQAQVSDYQQLMEINFLSAVRCSLAALPELDRTSGHLVNIGSLAAKTGWPWVAPYATSKHALAAYHHQLRLEGPKSVHYLFVCPGPIRRADAGVRYSAEASKLPTQATRPGAGVKLKGIPPETIAAQIRVGCEKRKADIVIPNKARLAFALAQLSPRLGDYLLKKFSGSKH